MFLLIDKDRLKVFASKPIGIEDSLFDGYVLCAPSLAETPDAKIKRLFQIKRRLRIPDKSIVRPQFGRTCAFGCPFCMFFRIAGDKDVRPQIKIVDHVISPFFWKIASTLWPAVKNERLAHERSRQRIWLVLARTSSIRRRLASPHAQPHGNSGTRGLPWNHASH